MNEMYPSFKWTKQTKQFYYSCILLLSLIIPHFLVINITTAERVSFKEATYGSLPNSFGQVFTMPSDGTATSYTISDCTAKNQFISDGSTLYADATARRDTLTLCPQNQWQTVKVTFEKFDVSNKDLLSVHNGNLAALRSYTAPLIGSASGYGASAAFGAWVQASCDPGINPSGCLTFTFKTNGDYNKGTGWDGWVSCESRDIQLQAPNINSQVWCGEYFDVLTIGGPTITTNCNAAIDDETMVEVYNANGSTCISTTVSKSKGKTVTQTFAVGVYAITYTLKSDPTKTVSTVFSVGDPSLTCNDRINVSMGSGCGSNLTPDMITENHCDPIPGIMHYEITIKDNFGKVIASGGKNGKYPYITKDMINFCGETTYTAEIKRVYFEDYTPSYCNKGVQVQTCSTELLFEDKTPPVFNDFDSKDVVYDCDIQLTDEGLKNLKPTFIDNCNYKAATLHTAKEISKNSNCDRTYLITWKAEDQCGNVNYLERTLEIKRPGIDKIVKTPDVHFSCGEDDASAIDDISKTGTVGLKIGYEKNGKFHATDTLDLSTETYVCDYILTSTDQPFPSDCGSKTLRYFQLLDWCKSSSLIPIDTQLIKFIDTLAPQINCSPHASLAMAQQIPLPTNSCATTPSFAPPSASDKCDPNVSVAMFTVEVQHTDYWKKLGDSFTHTGDLECGTYRVGWRAFDECHEQLKEDTCYRYFVIDDKTAPTAICKDQLNVSIGTDYARINAIDINNGSTDACGIAQLYTRRTVCGDLTKWAGEENTYIKEKYNNELDPTGWNDFVSIECCDLHQMVKLELLVIDNKGNYNFCWVDIRPEDKLSPVCSYLPAQTAYCDELHADELGQSTDTNNNGSFDYNEWVPLTGSLIAYYNQEFGDPLTTCSDNLDCNNLTLEQEYQMIDLNCGQLQVKRRFRAIDWKDNPSSWGEQTITINYRADWAIRFPVDWVGTCGSSIPDTDLEISLGLCDKIAYEVEDQVFQAASGSCFKVLRKFSIINWCKFNPDAPAKEINRVERNGMVRDTLTITSDDWGHHSQLTYTQILEVRDTEAPVVTIDEVEACITGEACDDIKYFSATATDCNIAATNDLQFNWEIYKDGYSIGTGAGNTFEWTVQAGPTYKVKWGVNDRCGNNAWEEQDYQFKDCKAPSPYCLDGLAIALMETGIVDIWANDFDLGSYDNCTSKEDLDIRIYHESLGNQPSTTEEVLQLSSSIDFSCDYIGTQFVSIYVIDAHGNWDYCTTSVIIQDNQSVCNYGQVAGKIYTADGTMVENTEVLIEGIGTMPSPFMTGANGQYDFEIDLGGDYTVRPQKNLHARNGVSTFDLVQINKHILGISAFDSPYQYIAADVNKSNTISAFDMVILRQLILGIIEEFPTNTSWRFIPSDYEFLTNDPLSEPFLEYIHINEMPELMTNLDFIAVKIGDISGNADTNTLTTADTRSTDKFTLSVSNHKLQKGNTFTVPIYPENMQGIAGYQFTLAFENLELINLEEGIAKAENFGMHLTDRGYITTSWNGTPQSSTLSQHSKAEPLFQLTFKAKKDGQLKDHLTITSAITTAEAYSKEGNLLSIDLEVQEKELTAITLQQNTPNPFKEFTTINFTLPEMDQIQLKVINLQGTIFHQQDITATKGDNTIYFNQHLPPGTYLYQLITSNERLTKKMLVLK